MKRHFSWSVFILLFTYLYHGNSQTNFTNLTKLAKKNIPTRSANPGGMVDLNGDLIDDIVVVDHGNQLKAIISNGKHLGLSFADSFDISTFKQWSLTAGDFDNSGHRGIITAGDSTHINLATFIDGKWDSKYIPGNFYAQGSNTVDINNDGWLDYFVCDDDGPSQTYINDGSGKIIAQNVIDFLLNDNTDGSGNYGSEWTDVNGDNLPDLCISKCRAGVTDPTDQRRINRLYINQGDGKYVDLASEFHLDSGDQSWVTIFGDLDNDGDQDAYLVNHYEPHILYENINQTHFQSIPLIPQLALFNLQGIMRDFDNDGFLDILLAGVEGIFLMHNNQDKTFTLIDDILGSSKARSFAVGDVNDDGFLDIHAQLGEPINLVGPKDDELWINNGNNHHFVKFSLMGSQSNRDGIGAHLTICGPWGKQVRYVKGGESYGIFNSLQQHFGLGLYDRIDSLIIKWPSGQKDVYSDLAADQSYLVQEGKCISASPELYADIQYINENSIILHSQANMLSYIWNNGFTSNEIVVTQVGNYFVKMIDSLGCMIISKPITVKNGCLSAQSKLIDESRSVKLCDGQTLLLSSLSAQSYHWSNGETNQTIVVDESQSLKLWIEDFCHQIWVDSIDIDVVKLDFNTKNDTIAKGEKASLSSDNANTHWYSDKLLSNLVYIGDTLTTPYLDTSTLFYAKIDQIIDSKLDTIGEKSFPTTNLYSNDNIATGNLVFDVLNPCTIHSVDVKTDKPGTRTILIKTKQGDTIFSKDFLLVEGVNQLKLDVKLERGQGFIMTTDENTNINQFGFRSPRLIRTFNATHYPYSIEDIIDIQTTTSGVQYYYYFYHWQIVYDIVSCESMTHEVLAYVQKDVSTDESEIEDDNDWYPNPTEGILYFHKNQLPQSEVKVYDILGRLVMSQSTLNQDAMDLSQLQNGIYIVCCQINHRNIQRKILKK